MRPLVLAAASLSALRIAMRLWIEEDLARQPIEVIDEILDERDRSFGRDAQRACSPSPSAPISGQWVRV